MIPRIGAVGGVLDRAQRTRDARLVRFCQGLLERYPLLWVFVTAEGVEPTNDHAERVRRRAVLWRRKSFGCQSAGGCRFAERVLTVIQTLRLHNGNALEYL